MPCAAPVVSDQVLPPSPEAVSLVARLPAMVVSSLPLNVSAAATGTSLTGVTFNVTVAVDVEPSASVMVYEKLSGPL